MKRIFSLMLALMLVFAAASFAGCQPTPEAPIVVNKNDGGLQDSISSAPAAETADEQISADEGLKWEDNFSSTDGKTNIIVDAKVEVPENASLPVIDCMPHDFTLEEVKNIVRHFYGDAELYDNTVSDSEWVEELLMWERIDLESLKTRGQYPEYPEPGEPFPDAYRTADNLNEEIKFVENNIKEYEEMLASGNTKIPFDEINFSEDNGAYFVRLRDESEIPMSFTAKYGKDSKNSSVSYKPNNLRFSAPEPIAEDENIGISISRTDAEKLALETVRYCGIDDCVITNVGKVYMEKVDYDPATPIKSELNDTVTRLETPYYEFNIGRTTGGVPSICISEHMGTKAFGEDGAEYREPWSAEQITVTVGEDGVVQFYWSNPSEILCTANENVSVLSWEEISVIAAEQLKHSLSVESFNEGLIRDANVERAVLNMMRVPKKDTEDEYYYLPVWDFIGSIEDLTDEQTVDPMFAEDISFLTLNAIDGSVIDRGLGY